MKLGQDINFPGRNARVSEIYIFLSYVKTVLILGNRCIYIIIWFSIDDDERKN